MGKMFGVWSGKLKIAVILLALALYVYVLVYLKTMYMRSKRLDSIEELALKNEKLIQHIHGLDEQLAMRVKRLNEFYEDY